MSQSAATIQIAERGAAKDGEPQVLDRRLFMQLLVFETLAPNFASTSIAVLLEAMKKMHIPGVIYEDVNHPRGFALLTWSENPSHFVGAVRPLLELESLREAVLRPEFTMLGRTYSSGYEADLTYWLLERPIETVTNEDWPWAIWYPLRRSGEFARLSPKEQGAILKEHGALGRAYGDSDLAHDVRLACHGLDRNDNEFVIGLVGKSLHPLSHIIEAMRKTRQTSEYISQMGPFFVGRASHRNS